MRGSDRWAASLWLAVLLSGCGQPGGEGGENTPDRCADGIDNDGDGKIDCADPECIVLFSGTLCLHADGPAPPPADLAAPPDLALDRSAPDLNLAPDLNAPDLALAPDQATWDLASAPEADLAAIDESPTADLSALADAMGLPDLVAADLAPAADLVAADLAPVQPPLPGGGPTDQSVCGLTSWQDVEDGKGAGLYPAAFVDGFNLPTGNIHWDDALTYPPNTDPATRLDNVRWCSGTLVSDDLFLTAAHCLTDTNGWTIPGDVVVDADRCRHWHVDFRYQRQNGNGAVYTFGGHEGQSHRCQSVVEMRLGGLDYMLLRLGGSPGVQWGSLVVGTVPAAIGDQVIIFEHPQQLPKVFGVGPVVAGAMPDILYHRVDTAGGSSGAGVVGLDGRLVGVHVAGNCSFFGGSNLAVRMEAILGVSPTLRGLACPGDCAAGTTRCRDAMTQETCGNLDADICNEWGQPATCAWGCAGSMCQPQCASDADCQTAEYCSNGYCNADVCAQGQSVCNNGNREQCNANGSGSSFLQSCTFGCAAGACSPQCAGDAGCPANQYCAGGACVPDVCNQGTTYCSGGNVVRCAANGSNESAVQYCNCGCANSACLASACALGTPDRCNGNGVEHCDGCNWASTATCTLQCSGGACCGSDTQPCCGGGVCGNGLVCLTGSQTCTADPPAQRVYRYYMSCVNAHWMSTNSSCYPSATGPTQGCGGCAASTTNPGCLSATCWRLEGSWQSYVNAPGYGSFKQIYHCWDGFVNFYQSFACATYGDPASLGWIATNQTGSWTTAIYLCQWQRPDGFTEQFLTTNANECATVGGTNQGGAGPWGYVKL